MSTKLYNGIKFNSNKFSEVIKQLHSLKEEAVNNIMKTLEDTDSYNFLNMCLLYVALEKDNPKLDKCRFEWELRKEMENPTDRTLGFYVNFNVVILGRKNKLYGLYYDEDGTNRQLLFDKGIATDFHYQDQTDKPESISDREWNYRMKVWHDIFEELSPCWVPKEAGAIYTIVDGNDIHITKEIFEKIKKKSEFIKPD